MLLKNHTYKIILCLLFLPVYNFGQIYESVNFKDSVESSLYKHPSRSNISSVPLITGAPAKIVLLIIAVKDHPVFSNEWPIIKNPADYPDEAHPLLGTFPDGTLLREYIDQTPGKSIPIEKWYEPQIEEYFKLNSSGKYTVNVVFPKASDGRALTTNTTYSEFVERNLGSTEGMVMRYNNWRQMADEVLEKVYIHNPALLKNTKYLSLLYQVSKNEFTEDSYTAFSPDSKFDFYTTSNELVYKGFISTSYTISPTLHEVFHRIGSIAGSPNGFEGLPDRTTIDFLDQPNNMTWGHDLMCNKGPIPSEQALYGVPPMLTMDRIFLEWIEPDEVTTIYQNNVKDIKLRNVNIPLTEDEKSAGFYRAAKVMIHPKFDGIHDEYFLLEYRAGTHYDRNFSNIYEPGPHKGILIWHIRERTKLLNRTRSDDNDIDLEIAVPYNGWYGNPIPDDDFPRNYQRPADWYSNVNAAGDFDYFDDKATAPFFPDGGVHRWELKDKDHPIWKPYFIRRNSLKSNFFTDESIRGIVTNKLTGGTRPSSKDWNGRFTNIAIYNIKRVDDYMTFDVSYSGGVLSSEDDRLNTSEYRLIGNYPNPFNPTTIISYSLPRASYVKINIFDFKGELISTLVDGEVEKGIHNIEFNAESFSLGGNQHLASGIYFYRLTAGKYSSVRKMMLLK